MNRETHDTPAEHGAVSARKLLLFVLAAAVVTSFVLLFKTGVPPFSGIHRHGKNVLLITLDTVRADRFGCYGYKGNTTPAIDALAARGTLFENAVAPTPITLPSHATIMTGLYPPGHGIRDNTTYRLSGRAVTLAETLSEHGYRTGAVVGAFVLDSGYGLDQGFDTYDDELGEGEGHASGGRDTSHGDTDPVRMRVIVERPAADVTRQALLLLRQMSGEPFFLWVHYFDPHAPYAPPADYRARYPSNPYDGEIAYVDANIALLMETMREEELLENTLVVIAGDHGESLGDHGEETHSIFIYDATVRVPLVMSGPGLVPAGRRVEQVVTLADVLPTILNLLGIEFAEEIDGRSLAGLMEEKPEGETNRAVYMETMFPYLNYGWSEVRGIRDREWKYIEAPRPELYRMTRDPGETKNLIERETDVARRYARLLESMTVETARDTGELSERAALSREERDRLRALGYVSGAPPERDRASLADPKDMIAYHEIIDRGYGAMDRGDYEEARNLFEQVVRGDPQNAVAHNMLGMISYHLGDTARSRAEFLASLEYNPNMANAHYNLGNLDFVSGDFTAAAARYERAVELNPWAGEYLAALARARSRTGEDIEAKKLYERAISRGFDAPGVRLAYGAVLIRLGLLQDAEAVLRRLERDAPSQAETSFFLGELYLEQGDPSRARTYFRRFLEQGGGNEAARREAEKRLDSLR